MPNAEVLATGTELLSGDLVDTNSARIARALQPLSIPLVQITVVGDDLPRMVAAIRAAMARSEILIISGGLGPTVDDVTREAVAEATGRPLIFDPELFETIRARFQSLGIPMPENNRRQAFRPQGSQAIPNPIGTAPGFLLEENDRALFALPGVPRELERMLAESVVPYLERRFPRTEALVWRVVRTIGLGESMIDERLRDLLQGENPQIGLNAHPGLVDIRIRARGTTREEAAARAEETVRIIRERLRWAVYGEGNCTPEEALIAALRERKITLATIERGTLGLLGGRLAAADPESHAFRTGEVRARLAVAPEHAAEAIRRQAGTTVGLAAEVLPMEENFQITVAMATPEGARSLHRGHRGPLPHAAEWAANAAMGLLWRWLQEAP
ncbi:MAG TPA: CinA family nicotinamide mononucleotide deamidase-related protein [Thermoflexus sp.]|nr:CinA family nicotinamide mononucleotide deamidase-related protein [Thermoflexus sp.]